MPLTDLAIRAAKPGQSTWPSHEDTWSGDLSLELNGAL
jgi:hypothetical protein